MLQGDFAFPLVIQIGILRKESKHLLIHTFNEPLVYGNSYQDRREALGDRSQIMGRVGSKISKFSSELIAIVVPSVAAEVLFKNKLAILDDQNAVNILIGVVANASDCLTECLFVYPNLS